MEFWKRCAIVYGAFSLVVPLMAMNIRQSGMDIPSNPAWQLINPLFNIIIGSWILLILGFLIRNAWIAMEKAEVERERLYKFHQDNERAEKEEAERWQNWVENKIEKHEERNKALKEELREIKLRLDKLEKPEEPVIPEFELQAEENSIDLVLEEYGKEA